MKIRHFEALKPVCPVCRSPETRAAFPLRIASVARQDESDGSILEGALWCSNPNCQREYPVIDGIPLLVPALRDYVAQNFVSICARTDLGEISESMLGDCCGPGSWFDTVRQHLSSYAWDHYAEFDPLEPAGDPRPGSIARLLDSGLGDLGPRPAGPIVDLGCGVGRAAFALSERCGEMVLGVDLNFAMLRTASEILRTGHVRYPRRRIGLVYDRRSFAVPFQNRVNVDFWACDATALPIPDDSFSLAVSLNVLDSSHVPIEHLREIARVLTDGGKAMIACPYDWSPAATTLDGWLGGHSQRGPDSGAAEPLARALLTPGAHPWSIGGLTLRAESDGLPWQVRSHDRATMAYRVHLLIAEAVKADA